jgi:L-alanine-DL-glutamate epimerase-like enolase superfamily enzyme
MKIKSILARWVHVPIPYEKQHVSDFGRVASFDSVIVRIETECGIVGWGEAKEEVGSEGNSHGLVAIVNQKFGPALVGEDPRDINRLWEQMYSGCRGHYALREGHVFPILGRRGVTVSAISGIDMALWDILGKSLNAPVWRLLGGRKAQRMAAYASGGWADAQNIGRQLQGYVDAGGFKAVKMRVGVIDGDPGELGAPGARRARGARPGHRHRLRRAWHLHGGRGQALLPAGGGLQPAVVRGACHRRRQARHGRSARRHGHPDRGRRERVQPIRLPRPRGAARGRRVPAGPGDLRRHLGGDAHRRHRLGGQHQAGAAPVDRRARLRGGMHVAAASPAGWLLEYSLGANPLLHELAVEQFHRQRRLLEIPDRPGLGVTVREEFVQRHQVA